MTRKNDAVVYVSHVRRSTYVVAAAAGRLSDTFGGARRVESTPATTGSPRRNGRGAPDPSLLAAEGAQHIEHLLADEQPTGYRDHQFPLQDAIA